LVVPVPVVVTPPGERVNVHVPVDGKPLRTTLPVETVHVGWVIVPIVGAAGVTGCVLITTFADDADVHPSLFVTVKEFVPVGRPEKVVLVPLPVVVAPPGFWVMVQVPVEGNPSNIALPVDTAQVGWVIVPTDGAEGVTGCVFITILSDAGDMQPTELVTV
jgi:hypothetical protein